VFLLLEIPSVDRVEWRRRWEVREIILGWGWDKGEWVGGCNNHLWDRIWAGDIIVVEECYPLLHLNILHNLMEEACRPLVVANSRILLHHRHSNRMGCLHLVNTINSTVDVVVPAT